MKVFYKILIANFVMCCFFVTSLQGATMIGTPPTVNVTSYGGVTDPTALGLVSAALNANLSTAFYVALIAANLQLAKFHNQTKLAKGFANANVYASRAATHQGFQDYSVYAITSGVMLGVQAPSFDPDYYDDMNDEVKREGDIYAGVSAGMAMFNFGLNTDYILPGLYLNLTYGQIPIGSFLEEPVDDVKVKSRLIGIGANYSWIKTEKYLHGFFMWRGVSFGTGIYYNKTEVDATIDMDPVTEEISSVTVPTLGEIGGNVIIDPDFILGLDITSVTIPLEVNTSVRVLWSLNLNFGVGIDFSFGSSDIIIEADGTVTTDIANQPNTTAVVTPGIAKIDGSTTGQKPSFINPRITTGIGINIVPVKIDVPIAFYLDTGISAGVTFGVVY